jgi:hypothetical protein
MGKEIKTVEPTIKESEYNTNEIFTWKIILISILCIKIRVKSIELSYVRNQNIFQ